MNQKIVLSTLLLLSVPFLGGCEVNVSNEQIEWQSVEAAPLEDGILRVGIICRQLDGWHRGREARLVIKFQRNRIMDGRGNDFDMTPEQWKGVVSYIRWHLERTREGDYLRASSPPSQMFREDTEYGSDDFGDIPHYSYRIRILDEESLEFETVGLWN